MSPHPQHYIATLAGFEGGQRELCARDLIKLPKRNEEEEKENEQGKVVVRPLVEDGIKIVGERRR